MFVLVIAIALWLFVTVRMVHSRLSRPATRPQPSIDPGTGYERWSPIDDMQLTRLLQRAVNED